MAKKKPRSSNPDRNAKFRQFFVATYVLEVLGTLSDEDRMGIDQVCKAYGIPEWRKEAETALKEFHGIHDPATFLNAVFTSCCDFMDGGDSGQGEAFLLRGLDCPSGAEMVMLQEQFVTGEF